MYAQRRVSTTIGPFDADFQVEDDATPASKSRLSPTIQALVI
jgi:hypothetical protein